MTEFITREAFMSLGSAAVAVNLATAVAKTLIPGVSGKVTNVVAFAFSFAVMAVVGRWNTPEAALLSTVNAMTLFWSATIINKANAGKESK